ncbi:hypothetical protein BJ170DRAFT_426596 [Xylariales sp. AK1849]|nr:hypothetical protein BJ170DRAFT_426596 [Xylariales sp. AK1849]
MDTYETRRLENIKRNAALVQDLGLHNHDIESKAQQPRRPAVKRRKLETGRPTRTSARIANASSRPTYNEGAEDASLERASSPRRTGASKKSTSKLVTSQTSNLGTAHPDLETIKAGWTSWTPVATPPTRDPSGTYHFDSHQDFTPNKSPEEIIREGCFGGSYWRPLYSKHLKTTIEDDWRELPSEWIDGLNIDQYLTNPVYNPDINKFGVACGQSIEEWEASGWIAHEYDVRGWFQWFCRFWMGRRCDDDARQISRWKKCVGETGRWRRTLLKKYVQQGIRSVFDDGDNDVDGERGDVSPVVHQTCHHWAYEVRQEALDRFWAEGT